MNRLIMILALLLAAMAAQAEDYIFTNYFTMGENDTLRIEAGSDTVTVPVRAHFDDLVNSWTLKVTYPDGMTPLWLTGGPDLAVPYMNSEGEQCIYNAVVTASYDMTTITSIITVEAYWPYGSGYFSFGTAMWEAGYYDEMFYMTFEVSQGFTGGLITIDGRVMGDAIFVGGVGVAAFYKKLTVIVTRPFGDVNCDGKVTISDVTALINLLLSGTATADCDLDGDGQVTISDVTALINYLLSHQW